MIPSCRQSAELLSAQQDRRLGPLQRLALGAHLAICKRCRIAMRQLEFLRLAARRWRDLD
jgi:hypothetical protein